MTGQLDTLHLTVYRDIVAVMHVFMFVLNQPIFNGFSIVVLSGTVEEGGGSRGQSGKLGDCSPSRAHPSALALGLHRNALRTII